MVGTTALLVTANTVSIKQPISMADFLFPLPQQNNERGAYAVPT